MTAMFARIPYVLMLTVLWGCQQGNPALQSEVQNFLDEYSEEYQKLYYTSSLAEWEANTHIVEGDTATANAVQQANEELANFTGSIDNIWKAQHHLERKEELTDVQVRQLDAILYEAADNPESVEPLVQERIRLENDLNNKLFGFDFKMEGTSVTPNDIDRILRQSNNLDERRQAWEASKQVGVILKDGLDKVRTLRNKTVQALGYEDYFSYQVSGYGMSREEMLELMDQVNRNIYPLYRELHTFARYELARKYGVKQVPKYLPAHWLPNRWGQDWSAMISAGGMDLSTELSELNADDIVHIAEDLYVSLGFDKLPDVFWEKSSLYPLPEDAGYKKNNHASAWHLDLNRDVRSLMSIEPNQEWYETTHHELGHIYYYISYSNAKVPVLLRRGANRAFHEAVGSLMGLASMQSPYLVNIGILPKTATKEEDRIRTLLKEALNYVVFIPFSAGVMTGFEHDLYSENLSREHFNDRWWELQKTYQGIVPPTPRGSRYNDAASKTHIINDAAQYYDYALSILILFQLHDHIASNILNQNPHATNYYGNEDVGKFLYELMRVGATKDWRVLIEELTGNEISVEPMMDYFEPLMDWLKERNNERVYTLPEEFTG